MKSKNSSPVLLKKLRSSSLFQMYGEAFEKVTGYRLDLQDAMTKEALSVPVQVGKMEPCFLVAEPVSPRENLPIQGLLESFSMQLGEEVNRSVLTSDAVQPQAVKDSIHYIRDHLGEKIQLDEVAEVVGVCSFQLCRLFKKHTGVTMTEYINRQRVERARKRLEDPKRQVSEVAYEVGFTSLSQFNRNFLKYAGESPSEYRVRLGKLEHCELAMV